MRLFVALMFVLALGVTAACGGDDGGGDEAAPDEPPSTVPAQVVDVDGHDHEMRTLVVGDTEREYWLFRPTTLDPAVPAPLVVNLHGLGGSAATVSPLGFNDLAEQEGIVVAHPSAIEGAWDLDGITDVDFVEAVIEDVSASVTVDPDRVYAIGFSMGGEMSALLACHLPDEITAVASVAMIDHPGRAACEAPRPARVLAILGETDRTYSIEDGVTGDSPNRDPAGPLAEEAEAWAATNGCGLDYDEQSVADGVVRREYPCESGALVVYIHAGGHGWQIWPAGGPDTNEVVWEFLEP